jgi:hypothetical protein
MKPTTAEARAMGSMRKHPRSKKWSCTGPKGANSISHSGDYSISSQRECRKDGGTEEPMNGALPSMAKDSATAVRRTPLKSIRERCLDCTAGEMAAVRTCDLHDCPLHPFRMGRGVRGKGSILKPIRAYCLWCTNGQVAEVRLCPSPMCSLHCLRMGRRQRKSACSPPVGETSAAAGTGGYPGQEQASLWPAGTRNGGRS